MHYDIPNKTIYIIEMIKTTISQANREISRTFQQSLEDPDFADDKDLLAVQRHKNIQSKTGDLVKYSRLDLIYKCKRNKMNKD